MSFLCLFGFHRRYRPGSQIWMCWGCDGMWARRQLRRGNRWEKVR